MSITRGATITNVFDVSIDLTDAVVLYITYKQYGRTVLEKQLEDCTVTQDKVTVDLTQAESLKFAENKPVQIQIRARLSDNSAHVSNIMKTTASELLKEGVI